MRACACSEVITLQLPFAVGDARIVAAGLWRCQVGRQEW